jgi:oligosaccharide repeat unit polymerase
MNGPTLGLIQTHNRRNLWEGLAWISAMIFTFVIAWTNIGPAIAWISCAALLCSLALAWPSCRPFSFHRGTIPSFWYVTYLVTILWPAFYVYSENDGPYRRVFLFAVESVIITVPIGWGLASRVLSFRLSEVEDFFCAPLIAPQVTQRFSKAFVRFFVFALVMTLLYLWEVKAVPLFYLIANPGDAFAAAVLREESFKLLNSPFLYIYSVLRAVLYPYLIMVSIGAYLVTRRAKWLWRSIIVLIAGVLYAALTIAKGPVAIIFLMVAFFFYYYKHGHLSRRAMATFFVIILLFPVLVATWAYVGTNLDLGQIGDVLQAIGDRLFHIPAEMVYGYFEFFPAQMGHLHGASIGMLSALLQMKHVDTPNVVGQFLYPNGIESITANAAFIGDLNADFGMGGVLIGSVLAGFIMQALHIWVIRRRKTVTTMAVYAFLTVTFLFLHSTALPQILASNGAILIFLIAWFFENQSSVIAERSRSPINLENAL